MIDETITQKQYDALGLVTVPRGMGAESVWIGGGRTGAQLAGHGGIEELVYFGAQPLDNMTFFRAGNRSAYNQIFRCMLYIGPRLYTLEQYDTQVFPQGVVSHMAIPEEGVEVEHALVLVNDAVLQTVRVLRNAHHQPLRLRVTINMHTRVTQPGRTWQPWQDEDIPGVWTAHVVDQPRGKESLDVPVTTRLGVVGDGPLQGISFHRGGRWAFEAIEPFTEGTGAMSLVFGDDAGAFAARCADLQAHAPTQAQARIDTWRQMLAQAPRLSLGRPAVESVYRQARLILEGMMPADLPGGMRASASHYWVWGWDSMVYCDCYLGVGRADFVRDMLDLYMRTADPVHGIGHSFDGQMRISNTQALPAQGLYIIMLYQYLTYTGDVEGARAYYDFAREIFRRTLAQGARDGLIPGHALFPDFPKFAGHNGHDISVFNNALFYQAARCIEHLAGMLGDAETATAAREAWMAMAEPFRRHLWDAERGFWYDSVDSRDFSPRHSYPAHAILWVTPFARDLMEGIEERGAAFIAEHLVTQGGIRMYPAWDPAFTRGDGNQMQQYYPVGCDRLFLKMMTATGRQELLERWLGWVATFWDSYTVPEGMIAEAENDGPHRPDNPGGKQAFAAKVWHTDMLQGVAGIDIDSGGLTAGPGLDVPVTITGLAYRGGTLNVETRGVGGYVREIAVNGVAVTGTCKAPAELCASADLTLTVTRATERPAAPQILAADGAALSGVQADARQVRARLTAPGAVRLRLFAPQPPTVTWQGKSLDVTYDAATGQGAVLLLPPAGSPLDGEIRVQG